MNWKIEVVTIPVSDQQRALDFYAGRMGFNVDIDHRINDETRLIQVTPPGSGCSFHLGSPMSEMEPGSIQGVFLVVPDVIAARAELAERGVEVGDVQVFDSGSYRSARPGDALDNVGFLFLSDPDGNRLVVQQIPERD